MKAQLLLMRGVIASLPEDDRRKVEAHADRLRTELRDDESIQLALMLVTLEIAAEDD